MALYLPNHGTETDEKKVKGIRQFIRKNRINYLTHFTRAENLKSILQFGLLPASILRGNPVFSGVYFSSLPLPPLWSSFVSLNISFPDYKLFMQLQNHQPSDWVILLIDSKVLGDFPCYFFPDRALSFINSAAAPGQVLNDFRSVKALKDLFTDRDGVKRKELDIPPFFPTNPCTEILCGFPIGPSYITQIWFYSEYKFNQWVLSNTEFALKQDKNLWATGLQFYSPRSDYTFWKTQRSPEFGM